MLARETTPPSTLRSKATCSSSGMSNTACQHTVLSDVSRSVMLLGPRCGAIEVLDLYDSTLSRLRGGFDVDNAGWQCALLQRALLWAAPLLSEV